jgi:hypothetical protein
MSVVRISNARVARDQLAEVERLLAESQATLREPLRQLRGLVHFYAGIDRELGQMTNVSVWETLEDAHQPDSLQPMLALRPIFEAVGVSFEVITNHEILWAITP